MADMSNNHLMQHGSVNITTTAAHHAQEERVQPLCLEHVAVTKLVHSIDQKIRLHNYMVRALHARGK
jgi:hypothetical protein